MTFALALVMGATACGDDPPPPAKTRPAAGMEGETESGGRIAGAAGPGPGVAGGVPAGISPYPKVPDEFRRELGPRDFSADPTGDINRDPFRSYLVSAPASAQTTSGVKDECERRMVAGDFGLRDLKLTGIIHQGTRTFAQFTDSKNLGHTAHRGDCLSKEKARVREIGDDRVVVDIVAAITPGSAPAPPRQEVWRLHPEDLDLEAQ